MSTNSTENRKNKSSNSERIDLRSFIPDISPEDLQPQPAGKKTLATVLGEIVWLFSQSPLHKHLKIADLEWAVMPAILLDQYKIYKTSDQVIGLALWAYLSEESEAKLLAGKQLTGADWGNNAQVTAEDGIIPNDGGQLWLIEMVTPFESEKNNHQQQILTDLIRYDLKDQSIKVMEVDSESGQRRISTLNQSTKR